MNLIDLKGKKFKYWTVIKGDSERARTRVNNHLYWICKCKCGRLQSFRGSHLVAGSIPKMCSDCKLKIQHNPKYPFSNILWKDWIYRAKLRGIKFAISKKYMTELFIKQKGLCAYSGIPLKFFDGHSGRAKTNASIDRIDSNSPYVKGNVQWVLKQVNFMKQALSHDEFLELVEIISRHSNHSGEKK